MFVNILESSYWNLSTEQTSSIFRCDSISTIRVCQSVGNHLSNILGTQIGIRGQDLNLSIEVGGQDL